MSEAVDFAHTAGAERRRARKARTLATLAWRHGMHPSEVNALTPEQERALARAADVNPPGEGSPTWGMVVDLLAAMWEHAQSPNAPAQDLAEQVTDYRPVPAGAWPEPAPIPTPAAPQTAQEDPGPARKAELPTFGDPRAQVEPRKRPQGVHPRLLAAREALAGADPTPECPPTARSGSFPNSESPKADNPAPPDTPDAGYQAPDGLPDPVLPAAHPTGWERTLTLPPLEPARACSRCPRLAVIVTLDTARCPEHPPTVKDWGHRLNYTAASGRSCPPERYCYCGTCPTVRVVPPLGRPTP